MSKSSGRKHRKKSHESLERFSKPMTDRAVYIGFIIIGVFVILLAGLFTGGHWREVFLGYLIAMTYLINFYTFQVYRGKHLVNWQKSLARLPLRFVGYGTKGGKPLEAAHDNSRTKNTLVLSIMLSLAVLVLLSFLLFPEVLRK